MSYSLKLHYGPVLFNAYCSLLSLNNSIIETTIAMKKFTTSVPPYSRPSNRSYKSLKQEEAYERNSKWESLTPQQQLDSLTKHPGESKKQIARIKKEMEKE